MTFREAMRVSVSRADEDIHQELVNRKLTIWPYRYEFQKGYKFILHLDGVHGTRVDHDWGHPQYLCVFVDGVKVEHGYPKLHLKHRGRDEKITQALESRGREVLRIDYVPPLGKGRRFQGLVDKIEHALTEVSTKNER